jgi:hypothetical protein
MVDEYENDHLSIGALRAELTAATEKIRQLERTVVRLVRGTTTDHRRILERGMPEYVDQSGTIHMHVHEESLARDEQARAALREQGWTEDRSHGGVLGMSPPAG